MNTKPKAERIILGIDPGTNILGWGVIKCHGSEITLVEMDVLNLKKLESAYHKLGKILSECVKIIDLYKPTELSIEAPFQGKNVQSMLKLGRAQGVAIAAALSKGVNVFEYAPRKIKQSITGNGNASKEQLSAMVLNILKLKEAPAYLDSTDGVAAAICHFFQNGVPTTGKTKSGNSWSSFVANNSNRIIE